MLNVLRRGSPARMDYIKRLLSVLLALVLCAGLLSPPRAKAVIGVDDVTIAAIIIFAASVGITFSVKAGEETGFNDWLGHQIQNFLDFTAKGLDDLFSSVSRALFQSTGEVRLSRSEAALQIQLLQYMQSQSAGTFEKFDTYMVVDGQKIDVGNMYGSDIKLTVYDPLTLVPFPVSYPSFSIVFSDYYRPEDNYHCFQLFVLDGETRLHYNTVSIGTYFNYHFYIDQGKIHIRFNSNNGLSDIDLSNVMYTHFYNLWLNGIDTVLDASGLVTDVVGNMTDDQEYVCPDVIGWDSADVAGSVDRVITGAAEGTLDVVGTVEGTGEVVIPGEGTLVGDIALGDVAAEQESLGAVFVSKFPFCIPWDMYNAVKLLAAPAQTPYWEVDFLAPISDRVGGWRGSTKVVIDMGEYEIIGQVSRWVSTILFCASLISGTKKLIWTA